MEQRSNDDLEGVVKWFDPIKGYGFIEQPEEQTDYFFHYTDIVVEKGERRKIDADDKVLFNLITDYEKNKLKAINVRKI
jgi:cold shock CspA family protein